MEEKELQQPIIEEQLQWVLTSRLVEEEELQQPIVEEQPQPILALRLVEEKKLQQHVTSGEEFLQEFFEERHVSNIILQHPRSKTKTMVKQKGKAPIEE